jgi:hypothetical protein
MPDIPQLVAAIDGRLAEISAEMSALGAAKAELAAPRAGSQAAGVAVEAIANQSPRRTVGRGLTPLRRQSQRSLRRRVAERVEVTRDAAGAAPPQRSTRTRTTSVARRHSAGSAVQAESLERLLADTPAGLSANAIAKQASAGYSRTLKLLHELEAAGRVRRSGSRRSSVWQLITDEDRIAQRAAELERVRQHPQPAARTRQRLVASPPSASAVVHEFPGTVRRHLPYAATDSGPSLRRPSSRTPR